MVGQTSTSHFEPSNPLAETRMDRLFGTPSFSGQNFEKRDISSMKLLLGQKTCCVIALTRFRTDHLLLTLKELQERGLEIESYDLSKGTVTVRGTESNLQSLERAWADCKFDSLNRRTFNLSQGNSMFNPPSAKTLPQSILQAPTVSKFAEKSRRPKAHEPQVIAAEEILVVVKRTKVELDIQRLGSLKKVTDEYESDEMSAEDQQKIFISHERQLANRQRMRELLPEGRLIFMEETHGEKFMSAKFVVAFGGDNHFQAIAHLTGNRFFMGINSDPLNSDAILTQLTADTFDQALKQITSGDFKIQDWNQISATLNGVKLPLACSEIFVGESDRFDMSRHSLKSGTGTEQQKSSGVLICTGAGSTGWYDSAIRYLEPDGSTFPRTSDTLRYLVTEPFQGRLNVAKQKHITLAAGETITLISRNGPNGVVATDCRERFPFPRGSQLTISLAEQPLKVLVPGSI